MSSVITVLTVQLLSSVTFCMLALPICLMDFLTLFGYVTNSGFGPS